MTTSTPLNYARAKRMRSEPTSAEQKLWGALRNRGLNGFKFVRQMPIGPYIVDFVCRAEKLIIEANGATHGDAADVAHDRHRTAFFEREGFRVHRVLNCDVYEEIGAVLDSIVAALERR